MPGLRVEEDERLVRGDLVEEMPRECFLSLRGEYPRGWEGRVLIRLKRGREAFVNPLLVLTKHPTEGHDERGERRHLHHRGPQRAVCAGGLWDLLVRMLPDLRDFPIGHERT